MEGIVPLNSYPGWTVTAESRRPRHSF